MCNSAYIWLKKWFGVRETGGGVRVRSEEVGGYA